MTVLAVFVVLVLAWWKLPALIRRDRDWQARHDG